MKDHKRLVILLPEALHRAFKVKCVRDDKTMKEALEAMIKDYING